MMQFNKNIQRQRVLKTDLQIQSNEVVNQRLHDYLKRSGLPPDLREQLKTQAQFGGGNATQVFNRLRLLISEHGRRGYHYSHIDITDASIVFRLCHWLNKEQYQNTTDIKHLLYTPPINRSSMTYNLGNK
jgi:hypothetical protein